MQVQYKLWKLGTDDTTHRCGHNHKSRTGVVECALRLATELQCSAWATDGRDEPVAFVSPDVSYARTATGVMIDLNATLWGRLERASNRAAREARIEREHIGAMADLCAHLDAYDSGRASC